MIKFEDLDLTEDEMEKIAAGARIFLGPGQDEGDAVYAENDDGESAPLLEEFPEEEEAPSDLVTVTRRNLR